MDVHPINSIRQNFGHRGRYITLRHKVISGHETMTHGRLAGLCHPWNHKSKTLRLFVSEFFRNNLRVQKKLAFCIIPNIIIMFHQNDSSVMEVIAHWGGYKHILVLINYNYINTPNKFVLASMSYIWYLGIWRIMYLLAICLILGYGQKYIQPVCVGCNYWPMSQISKMVDINCHWM